MKIAPLIVCLACWFGLNCSAQTKDFVRIPSGITFPANIEGRFRLGPIDDSAGNSNTVSFYYL